MADNNVFPMRPDPGNPGFVATVGSCLYAGLVNGLVVVLTFGPLVLFVKAVF